MNQGQKFKLALDRMPITKKEVANRMGIARETLYNMFKSERLQDATILKIKDLFGIDLASQSNTHFDTQNITSGVKMSIEELVKKIKELEQRVEELKADKEDMRQQRDVWQQQYLMIQKELSKKRDPRHEDGGSTIPTGGNK